MEIFEIVTYFILLALLSTAIRVVTTSNVIHAAISLVFTLALTAILFLILSTEFVALVLVLVYIGAVIVLFEWVGLNSSLPRIIAVPIHLVNTFGLLGSYAILYKILEDDLKDIKFIFNKSFILISFLFLLSGATGSITALADVLFPSASFIEGFLADFDKYGKISPR